MHDPAQCAKRILPVKDTLDVLSGKWKLPIIHALGFCGRPLRFKELQREIDGITARMLSKELKDLEMNELVSRTVYDTAPMTVEYKLTDHGGTLYPVINALYTWGVSHRQRILGQPSPAIKKKEIVSAPRVNAPC